MQTVKFMIPNISCGHCVHTIQQELTEIPGVQTVEGDPGSQTVTVSYDSPADLDQLKKTLAEINYPPQAA